MARVSNIERYGLQRVANNLLAPLGDGSSRTLGDISEELTRRARLKALEENPDMAPSLLDDIKVTTQAILRYKERSGSAAKRIISRNEALATDAAQAQLNGLGTLLQVRRELLDILKAKKTALGAIDPKAPDYLLKLAKINMKEVAPIFTRLESSGQKIIDLELLGTDPAMFATFLRILERGASELFGEGAADRLKEWLQEQDEFTTLAMALGWTKPDDEAPPSQGGGGVVN